MQFNYSSNKPCYNCCFLGVDDPFLLSGHLAKGYVHIADSTKQNRCPLNVYLRMIVIRLVTESRRFHLFTGHMLHGQMSRSNCLFYSFVFSIKCFWAEFWPKYLFKIP